MEAIEKFNVVCGKISDSLRFLSLGVKYKNLGCIRYNTANSWNGQIGFNNGFCRFDSFSNGVRALVFILCKYVHHYNLRTIESIIQRYAPKSDGNDTFHYVRFCIDNNTSNNISCKVDEFRVQLVLLIISIIQVECGFKLAFTSKDFIVSLQDIVYYYVDEFCKSQCIYGKGEI